MNKPRKIQATSGANAEHRGSEGPNPVFPAANVKGEVSTLTPSAKPSSKQQQLAALIVRDEGATLDETTGVLEGAAEGVTDFYATMPLSGTEWIDTHFQRHVTPADRMLACLFTGGAVGAARILRAFGVRRGSAGMVAAANSTGATDAPVLSASP